jgi:mRNA interferase RelE/StbE
MKQPPYKLRVPDGVARLVRNMHPQLKKKVKASLKNITSDPDVGKSLKDELSGLRSFRVSKFRIIYRVSLKKEIEIISIGPREHIYRETFRLLKKEEQ